MENKIRKYDTLIKELYPNLDENERIYVMRDLVQTEVQLEIAKGVVNE